MKRAQQAASGRLLSPTDSVKIRELSIEKARIIERLRQLDEREIASFIPRQLPEISTHPIAGL